MIELTLFAVVVLQFAYIVYSDIQNRRERELLQLKLMSANLQDYKSALEDTPKDSPKDEEDPYISMEEANIEQIVRAKEKE